MDITKIIIKPYLTEKSYLIRNLSEKQVITFVVDPKANKHQIAQAFFTIYGVKPEKINIVNKKPAKTKTRTLHPGYTKFKKIAYVILAKGTQIAISKEESEDVNVEVKEKENKQKEESKK